jgi:DNA-binding CsgD family transcriptional regulator
MVALVRRGLPMAEPLPAYLTSREREVAQLAAAGLTTREISGKLFISSSTVRTHLRDIYRKLRVRNRAELGRRLEALIRTSSEPPVL